MRSIPENQTQQERIPEIQHQDCDGAGRLCIHAGSGPPPVHAYSEEQGELPDVILTDGGKGQMEVVRQVIEDELHLNIPIVGLAKDNRHRTSEVLFGFPPLTIGIKQGTPLFHLLEQIQDEVHRFAITFHRDKRSKSQVASALDSIKGIGEKRKSDLLRTFKSVARIRKASLQEIAAVIGEAAAINVKEALK